MAEKYESNPPVIMFPVADVIVDREVRQRSELDKDIDSLADEIEAKGLLHPITIHEDGRLVTGERRLEAHRRKGWPVIRAQIYERLSPIEAYKLELTENAKRRNLSWQDEVRAVGILHQMRLQQTNNEWTALGTANDIGYSETKVQRYLLVFAEMADPEVMGCQTFDGALNLLRGRAERARAAASNRGLEIAHAMPVISPAASPQERGAALSAMLRNSLDGRPDVQDADTQLIEAGRVAAASLERARAAAAASEAASPIITGSFLEWAESYEGQPFDVLHVDFPYGKGYEGSNTRRTGRAHIAPAYADDPEIFWELVECFITWQDKLAYPIAHLLFWFDFEKYTGVLDTFKNAGWHCVQPFPLIWAKPGQGNAADPRRRPRHVYETALLFSRGDRKIVAVKDDVFIGRKEENLHINQKSEEMLTQFLSLIVDEHSAVLDPTCGSGSALAVAKRLGANRILGIELDPVNANVARHVVSREKVND